MKVPNLLSKKAVRRLTQHIEFMESLPPEAREHFYMNHWFDHVSDGVHDHGLYDKARLSRRDLNYCGTAACAFGWAGVNPAFRRAGLELRPYGVYLMDKDGLCESGIPAASKFFDITDDQSCALFSGSLSKIKTPKQWAKHARKLLREWERS